MINNIAIFGRLTSDPELKYTQSGSAVCEFSIAVNDKYGDKENTYFFNCIAWSKLGEVIAQYFQKGSQIPISGKLIQQTWEREGKKMSTVKIQVSNIDFVGKK